MSKNEIKDIRQDLNIVLGDIEQELPIMLVIGSLPLSDTNYRLVHTLNDSRCSDILLGNVQREDCSVAWYILDMAMGVSMVAESDEDVEDVKKIMDVAFKMVEVAMYETLLGMPTFIISADHIASERLRGNNETHGIMWYKGQAEVMLDLLRSCERLTERVSKSPVKVCKDITNVLDQSVDTLTEYMESLRVDTGSIVVDAMMNQYRAHVSNLRAMRDTFDLVGKESYGILRRHEKIEAPEPDERYLKELFEFLKGLGSGVIFVR